MQPQSAVTLSDAQSLAASLPALLIEVDRVASTVIQGVHGRRRKGTGETFWEYRRFAHEDPAYRIDWRQSAKSDALYVRENEWEAAQACWFWIDSSPSMHYRSEDALPSKFERSLVLGLACASLLLQAGERVADFRSSEPPRHGARAIERLAEQLWQRQAQTQNGFETVDSSLPPQTVLGPFSDVVMISDYFVDMNELEKRFAACADQRYRVHVIQVIDPAEEDLPFHGRTRFEGAEEKLNFLAGDVDELRSSYHKRFLEHCAHLNAMCGRYGWSCNIHRTDRSPQAALLALYMSLSNSDSQFTHSQTIPNAGGG